MYRSEFPRICQLSDLIQKPDSPVAYFRDLDKTLGEWAAKRRQFCDIEQDLQGLDSKAWACLKTDVAPLLNAYKARLAGRCLMFSTTRRRSIT